MAQQSFLEFIREKLGTKNWVIARRTAGVVRRYGDDVVCISQKRYSAIKAEHEGLSA